MSTKLWASIFLLLLSKAYCAEEEGKKMQTLRFPLKFMFLFSAIIIVAIIRYLVKSFEISIPFNVFSMILGAIWGCASLYSPWIAETKEICPQILDYLYEFVIPPLMFTVGFSLDTHTFVKSLPQIFIISIPVSLVAAYLNGLLMKQMLDNKWTYLDALRFGVICCSTYPIEVLQALRETTVISKYIIVLLEGEMMLSAAVSACLYTILTISSQRWIIYWYQFVMNFVRIIVGSVFLGYIFGTTGSFLLKMAYNDSPNLMLLSISMCYTSFFVGEYVANGGLITTIIASILMSRQRPALAREVEAIIDQLWGTICMTLVGVAFVVIGVETAVQVSTKSLAINEYFVIFVTYLISNITRFLSFLLFSPILSRMGYGLTFRNMIVCVWSGMRSPLTVNLAWKYIRNEDTTRKGERFFVQSVGLFFMMLLINASFIPVLFRTIGLSVISASKYMNMNNCMRYIYDARARMVAILKMDRLLSDANWPLVMTATSLKHPYKKALQSVEKKEIDNVEEDEHDEDYFLKYKFTYCPDCHKNIPNEPTKKEMKEMVREAKMRLLKHKKTTYSREYENGMLSKEGVRTLLQAVQYAMESEDLVIELDGLLEMFSKENRFHKFMRTNLQNMIKTKGQAYKAPRTKWRLRCHKLLHSIAFNPIMNSIVVTHMILISIHFSVNETAALHNHAFILIDFFFFLVYLGEFFIKILAYSWVNICEHGVGTYIRSGWNIIEFSALLASLSCLIAHIVHVSDSTITFQLWIFHLALSLLLGLRICKVWVYVRLPELCRKIANNLIQHFSMETEKNKATAYELAKTHIDAEDEILDNIEQIVDNEKIREELIKKTEHDRLIVTRRLGVAEIEAPWITTTFKTKTAVRTVLNSIKDDILELKVSGWVDDVEYNRLTNALDEKYREVDGIKYVQPAPPKLIFWEAPFMVEDADVMNFLFSNVSTRKYDPGDTVINHYDVADGIYLVITGMFQITFLPDQALADKIKESGILPVIDYIYSNTYDREVVEYAMPGNTLGVLSAITERRYDGKIVAETHSEVFLLKTDVIKKAMKMDPDPVGGLECRIWKFIAFKKALNILLNVPFYQSYTREKIKFIVERSFVPNLANYKIFIVNDMIQDILLIEGVAVDYNTRDVYTGPCHIPRAVQKLVLPRSSLMNMESPIETRLMIVPAKDFDKYEVMIMEELTGELANYRSTKCLRHYIKKQQERKPKDTADAKVRSLTKQLRKTAIRVDSDKSKITFTSKSSKTLKGTKSRDASRLI